MDGRKNNASVHETSLMTENNIDTSAGESSPHEKRTDPVSYASLLNTRKTGKIANFRILENTESVMGADVAIPLVNVQQVNDRFANTLVGYFFGKRLAFPIIKNHVNKTWAKYGLQKVMMHSKGIFFFKFDSELGIQRVLEEGPWMIRTIPLILNPWSPNLSLIREDITSVPVWIKMHDDPIAAFSEDRLSMIATKLGRPIMLNACTSSMCMESWGRTSFARALIEITSDQDLKDNLVVAILRINGTGHTMESIRVEYDITPVRVEDDMEGFTTVARKGGKGKNNDQTNPKLVDGIHLNKSKLNFYYIPVQKQKQKDTKAPTTDSVNMFELKNSYDAL
ncbi:zinc knuckle CX2CX4HX4C containing protein [Tanacetum coccineum]